MLAVWTAFDMEPQENWMIAAAILAMNREVVCWHNVSSFSCCRVLISKPVAMQGEDWIIYEGGEALVNPGATPPAARKARCRLAGQKGDVKYFTFSGFESGVVGVA